MTDPKCPGDCDRVGIVVPTLGTRPEWLRSALDSITGQEGVQVIVAIVAPRSADLRLARDTDGIAVLRYDVKGLSNAINYGYDYLRDTGVEFVSWLGDDDMLSSGSLRRAVRSLRSRPGAVCSVGRTTYIRADGSPIYRQVTGRWAFWYALYGQNYVAQPGSLFQISKIFWHPFVDANLANAMDLDLFLRAWNRDRANIVYVRKNQSFYRLHNNAITATKSTKDESESVRLRYRKHAPPLPRALLRLLERVWVKIQWTLGRGAHVRVDSTSGGQV